MYHSLVILAMQQMLQITTFHIMQQKYVHAEYDSNICIEYIVAQLLLFPAKN